MNALQRAYEEGVKLAASSMLASLGGAGIGGLAGALSAGEGEDAGLRALLGAGAGAGLGHVGRAAGRILGKRFGEGRALTDMTRFMGNTTNKQLRSLVGAHRYDGPAVRAAQRARNPRLAREVERASKDMFAQGATGAQTGKNFGALLGVGAGAGTVAATPGGKL